MSLFTRPFGSATTPRTFNPNFKKEDAFLYNLGYVGVGAYLTKEEANADAQKLKDAGKIKRHSVLMGEEGLYYLRVI